MMPYFEAFLPTELSFLFIKENDVMDHVAGYCVAHDVSARDLQLKKNGGQWLLGKTFDTFCPIGPALVTPDEISGLYCFLSFYHNTNRGIASKLSQGDAKPKLLTERCAY